MVRSRKIRTELERKIRDALRTRDMDTNEIWHSVDGSKRTVQGILSEWHRDNVLFYHPVSGKHTLRLTLAAEYMKGYEKYARAMIGELEKLEARGNWCRTLTPIEKAGNAYTALVASEIAKASAEMVMAILASQDRSDEASRERHLDMMIDIYLRGRLQVLRSTGVWNNDVAEQAFQDVLSDYLKRSGQYLRVFSNVLGRPARWRAAREKAREFDRKGQLHAVR
jgi:hypothetical protein